MASGSRIRAALACALLAVPNSVVARQGDGIAAQRAREHEPERSQKGFWDRLTPRLSLGGSNALYFYGSAGALYALGSAPAGEIFIREWGPYIEANLGLQGFRFDLGYGIVHPMSAGYVHFSYLRGWGERQKWLQEGLADAHYLGPGINVRVILIRFHLGVLWRMAGDRLGTSPLVPIVEVGAAVGF